MHWIWYAWIYPTSMLISYHFHASYYRMVILFLVLNGKINGGNIAQRVNAPNHFKILKYKIHMKSNFKGSMIQKKVVKLIFPTMHIVALSLLGI